MSPGGRRLASRLLVVLASVAIVLALVVGYVRHAAVDSDQVANRATTALREFDGWSVRNVPRAENARADGLVNEALDERS